MCCYMTTRLLVPQSAKGSRRYARLRDPLILLLRSELGLASLPPSGTSGPNYPGRKTRLSQRPLGNTHHGSLQITSLCGCATSFKRVTLTVACHWRGREQQRAGERRAEGGGGRRGVGRLGETLELQTQQERASERASERRAGAVAGSPWSPRTPPPR